LDLTFNEKGFWTASDTESMVYKLDNWGRIEKSFRVKGADLEGISVIDEKTLVAVLETKREIIVIDTGGSIISRKKIDLNGEFNNGLEGITFDAESRKYFVLNEKKPCMLITLDVNLNEISRDTLKFVKDASGIHFDAESKTLWILSDESQCVVQCDSTGKPIKKYGINISKPEGITIDASGKKMYIVSDMNDALYVFNLE
jgi:uncharacterized protein YjiK